MYFIYCRDILVFGLQGYKERELSNKLTNFTIAGLGPGETYRIELKTKTGDRVTRQPVQETVLTKPERVTSLTVDEVQTGRQIYLKREDKETTNFRRLKSKVKCHLHSMFKKPVPRRV
jgi:hypothetical protein